MPACCSRFTCSPSPYSPLSDLCHHRNRLSPLLRLEDELLLPPASVLIPMATQVSDVLPASRHLKQASSLLVKGSNDRPRPP